MVLKGKRSNEERSADPAAQEMLIRADEVGISPAFSSPEDMVPCNIGGAGMCCKQCGMGPCRLTKEGQVGVCGATIDTIQARNLVRAIAAGTAAHSDHGRDMGVVPRGVDREVVEALHRTHIGDDQDAVHILKHAIRTGLADGWGGSMMATDISDILFGTPAPLLGQANLGVLKDDMVNVVVHGHEPTLSNMIVAASQDPEIIEYAKQAGAKGVNLSGICCTANEILMRQGIPAAGNFLHQELAILTGAVEAMVVDVQCIMQALVELASNFHTKIITTSPKVQIKGATHIEYDEHKALTIAKQILRTSIDNYKHRGATHIPQVRESLVPGFSHDYINYRRGAGYRASFRPLNDAIMAGRIRGVAAIVGCKNPRDKKNYP